MGLEIDLIRLRNWVGPYMNLILDLVLYWFEVKRVNAHGINIENGLGLDFDWNRMGLDLD